MNASEGIGTLGLNFSWQINLKDHVHLLPKKAFHTNALLRAL